MPRDVCACGLGARLVHFGRSTHYDGIFGFSKSTPHYIIFEKNPLKLKKINFNEKRMEIPIFFLDFFFSISSRFKKNLNIF